MKKIKEIVQKVSLKKAALFSSAPVLGSLALAVPAFAAETPTIPGVAITTEMLQPIIDGVTGNLGVIIPVGITIFAILLGVSLVPKIIKKFASGN